jgi:hypothetical protein
MIALDAPGFFRVASGRRRQRGPGGPVVGVLRPSRAACATGVRTAGSALLPKDAGETPARARIRPVPPPGCRRQSSVDARVVWVASCNSYPRHRPQLWSRCSGARHARDIPSEVTDTSAGGASPRPGGIVPFGWRRGSPFSTSQRGPRGISQNRILWHARPRRKPPTRHG